jgi:hypothetical protein
MVAASLVNGCVIERDYVYMAMRSDELDIGDDFSPLRAHDEASCFLRSIVDRDELGEAQRYIFDPTLRRIYWLNLIRRQRSGHLLRLAWRSGAINEAVRRIVRGS